MTHLSQNIFNLLLNSAFSFWIGVGIVSLCVWLFRIENSRWKLFLLSLPFVKILWDIFHRIPSTSILHSGINPLDLPPKHQTLTIGAGFSEYGPLFNLEFSSDALNGKHYSTSVPDYAYYWLERHWGHAAPALILGVILAVSAFFIARRIYAAVRFEIARRTDRRLYPTGQTMALRFRSVDIYSSEKYLGTPFTGGVWRPYICFPKNTLEALSVGEREAVLQHEIAHIAHWDLLITLWVKAMGDLLWFVPGYRTLSRKIDRLREILADETAVRNGASGPRLASALVKLKEIPEDGNHAILYSAFLREKSLLRERVENLVGDKTETGVSRFGWRYIWLKLPVTFWTICGVMLATFGGNHEATARPIPPWAERLFHYLGFM